MIRYLLLTAVCVLAAGCNTHYGDVGPFGGVSANKEADGTWLIVAIGNARATVEEMSDFTFLKAAEVAKQQGANCFEIVSQYAAMKDVSIGTQYGVNNYQQPDARLRIHILDADKTCDEKTNADLLIARLRPKVNDPKAYKREAPPGT
jgi:hypothetical protein